MTAGGLRLGLLVESGAQLNQLRNLIQDSGNRVQVALLTNAFNADRPPADEQVDAWLVILEREHPLLENWLAQLDQAVIVDEGCSESDQLAAWCRRMQEKLHQLKGTVNLAKKAQGVANEVWILAASTGGPEAVRAFFSELSGGLALGFVYVQHMDPGYEQTLAQMLERHGQYPAYIVRHGDILRAGSVGVIANADRIELQENGTFAANAEAWPGPYCPSIDQVLGNLACHYGQYCGAIIFTGMGDDGAAGARIVQHRGGQVWVQEPQTCTVSAMPDAALDTGVVSYQGSPAQLAQQLNRVCANR
jgi:chemosensory pili system protein ChpB (putative protein-glutamate methylesterase)